jgi:DNA-binding transcriptional ArsR family regulator
MSANDPPDAGDDEDIEPADVREELDRQRNRADRANPELDEGIIDLLSRALDTDTRTRIYVRLRQRPDSTVEEIAEGTGVYPGAVRRVLSDLHEEGVVECRERTDDDTEYIAIPPNELIDVVFGHVRDELDRMFGLDRRRGRERERTGRTEPVTIPVEDETDNDDQ